MIESSKYKIDFTYEREPYTNKPLNTICLVWEEDNTVPLTGMASLHPMDNPVKEVGRKLALARAINLLPLEERKKVWQVYFSRKP